MTETQNQKSEIMNIDMHDTPLHKWERELNEAQKRGDEYGQKYAKTMLERDQLKAEVERQANNNKLLLVQQEHEEQTREFLRCEAETLKAQVSELINQRNQLLKKKPNICPNCKEEVKFWADHIHSLPNQATSYSCFSSQQLKAELAEAKSRLPHVGKPYMDLWRDVDRLAQEVAGVMVERDQLKAEVERLKCADFCQLTKPGRGDCEHFIGLPGISIPGQHDGPDDTKDCYDKPNGWCWACWRSYENSRLRTLVASYEALSEEVGTEFEGVDEVKEVIRLLKQERDQLKAELLDVKTQLEFIRTWASKTHDELQHQSQLRQQWRSVAEQSVYAVNTLLAGAQHNVPACVTAALARFNDMEKNP